MRITFVLPYAGLAGGIRVVAIYADRLCRRGHQVTVVSTPPKRFPLRRKIKRLLSGKGWVRTHSAKTSYFDGNGVPHRVIDAYRPMIDADVPDGDVVVATWWETAEWMAALSPEKGTKVHFIQGNEPEFAYAPGGRAQVAAVWKLPTYKITLSHSLHQVLTEQYGQRDVDMVLNAVDHALFFADPRIRQPVATVGVLYTSHPVKGFDISIRAIELARRQLPQMRVLAFGSEQPSPKLPLPPSVSFFLSPPQKQIRALYSQCDVWLCGSRSEGFHLPPLEAMACRCPVVSTRVGGPLDVVEDGVNGYLVDVEDAEALADRLLRVLRCSWQEWRTMSDAAYATAHRYTWEEATKQFETALQRAIERSKQGQFLAGVE